jgi:hypothetical protein
MLLDEEVWLNKFRIILNDNGKHLKLTTRGG